MRPTKGEINVTPASAQATACENENNNVKLQCTPCFFSRVLAALKKKLERKLINYLKLLNPDFNLPESLPR